MERIFFAKDLRTYSTLSSIKKKVSKIFRGQVLLVITESTVGMNAEAWLSGGGGLDRRRTALRAEDRDVPRRRRG